ncbi:ANFC protein, partial [Promerops cafer]|nr:ANFC protein [Promerops cafer]
LKLLFFPGFLLLLIVSQNQAGARSLSSLQSLSELLDEDLEHPPVSEEWDHKQDDLSPAGVFDQQDTELQWIQSTRAQPKSIPMGVIQRFFSDLLSSSRRYQGRSKKGLSRGCFGVRLDRIGSLSGLGC